MTEKPDARSSPPSAPEPLDDDLDLTHHRPIDPALLLLVMIGVTILGLRSLSVEDRYTFVWVIQIIIGIAAILVDNLEVEIPTGGDMLWGIGFGLIIGAPLLLIGAVQLRSTALALFPSMNNALVFQSLVLVMPAAETLLFRGAIQATRGWLFTVLVSSIWSVLLFFPQLQVGEFPLVALVIGLFFVIVNFAYSYLKVRFGLFASWTCQITINLLLLFATRFV